MKVCKDAFLRLINKNNYKSKKVVIFLNFIHTIGYVISKGAAAF